MYTFESFFQKLEEKEAEYRKKGLEQGRAQSLSEGRIKGLFEGRAEAQNIIRERLIAAGIAPQDAIAFTNLS